MSSENIKFFINNKIFEGFEDVTITRFTNSLASTFRASVVNKWHHLKKPVEIRNGNPVKISIGEISVFNGFIESAKLNLNSSQRKFTISGRSKAADIIDSFYVGLKERVGVKFSSFINEIIKPFGIKAEYRAKIENETVFDVTIKPAENIKSIIERLIKERNLIVYAGFNGNIIFDRNASKNSNARIKEGVNLISGAVSRNTQNRFSEYRSLAQSGGGVVSDRGGRRANERYTRAS